jgi:hypothetical protein
MVLIVQFFVLFYFMFRVWWKSGEPRDPVFYETWISKILAKKRSVFPRLCPTFGMNILKILFVFTFKRIDFFLF